MRECFSWPPEKIHEERTIEGFYGNKRSYGAKQMEGRNEYEEQRDAEYRNDDIVYI